MTGLGQDARSAWRQIRQRPVLALIVVLTLGSSMGVSTAVFATMNGLLFRPWDVRDPGSVVALPRIRVSEREAQVWAEQSQAFSGLAARRSTMAPNGLAGTLTAYDFVTANYFDVLGLPIVLGRGFDRENPGREVVEAVISHRTWRTTFGEDPAIEGRRFTLQGKPIMVVGVLTPDFEGAGTLRQHLWVPMSARVVLEAPAGASTGAEPRSDVQVVGRLKPGVSAAQASAEIKSISERYRAALGAKGVLPDFASTKSIAQRPRRARDFVQLTGLLLAIVFLNFIACANVSNLFLARGFSRRGEFATRLALGASRVRLVRQLLVEALLLAAAAGLVGVAVSMVLPEHILADIPGTSVVRIDARPDIRVFIWTSALAALVCLLFGLGPALRTTRLAVSQVLKDTNGNAPSTLKTSLPAMQALVSVFALAIAGFVLRSEPQMQARRMERSFDGLTVVRVAYPADFDASRRASTARDVLEGLRSTSSRSAPAAADREPGDDARQKHAVSPSYFPMLGMPLMAGRTFHEDGESGVAVVNESFARAEWGDASALGRRVKATETDASGLEVIGVVRDGVHAQPAWFVSLAAADLRVIYVAEAEEAVRLRAARMSFSDGTGPSLQVGSGAEWSRRAFPGQAFSVKLFTEFGFFALALAILGLFGLSDHAIRQRTREIGVRAVLGAGPLQILEAVMRPALRALVTGTAAGLVLSLAAGVLLRRLQFPEGVHPFDSMVFIVVSFTMAGAGLVALAWPARRALRVRPAEALRYE